MILLTVDEIIGLHEKLVDAAGNASYGVILDWIRTHHT